MTKVVKVVRMRTVKVRIPKSPPKQVMTCDACHADFPTSDMALQMDGQACCRECLPKGQMTLFKVGRESVNRRKAAKTGGRPGAPR